MPYDARDVANTLLDFADSQGIGVSPLALQKVLYFLQGWWLVNKGEPIISQAFEAWDYGPVLRVVYNSFKDVQKGAPIRDRAERFDYATGSMVSQSIQFNYDDLEFFASIVNYYSRIDAFLLVEMTHLNDGPWDLIWNDKIYSPGYIIENLELQAHFEELAEIYPLN